MSHRGARARCAARTARPAGASTWLCLRWCISTFGMPSGVDDMNTAVPLTRGGGAAAMSARKQLVGHGAGLHRLGQLDAARATTSSSPRTRTTPTASGNQPPSAIFAALAAKNVRSMTRNGIRNASASRQRRAPAAPAHQEEQVRRDPHRAGDRDAVRGGEARARAELEDEGDAAGHQEPVHLGDVDLPLGVRRRMDHRDARPEPELHRLPGQREHAGDQRLRRDHRRHRREHDHRDEQRAVDHRVERVGDRCRACSTAAGRPGRSSSAAGRGARS